jgi:REP element-mobilizing transposase RayT
MKRDPINPESFYHIYNRSNGKKKIFFNNADYGKFIEIITRAKNQQDVLIDTYCIMPNHYHLLVKLDANSIAMGNFVKSLQISYAKYYNKKYNHTGHVFGGEYKREEVATNDYYEKVKKYILKNPVKAELVSDSKKWPYSGHFQW